VPWWGLIAVGLCGAAAGDGVGVGVVWASGLASDRGPGGVRLFMGCGHGAAPWASCFPVVLEHGSSCWEGDITLQDLFRFALVATTCEVSELIFIPRLEAAAHSGLIAI